MKTTYKRFDFVDGLTIYKRNLPHWRQTGCAYFVTFRLADSIPQALLREWATIREGWIANHPQPWTEAELAEFQEKFTEQMEEYLHAGSGSCLLRKQHLARVVADALNCFNGERYALGDYAVMPNHVHAIVHPFDGFDLDNISHSWKSYTSKEINRLAGQEGQVWAEESYDHIIRHEGEMLRISNYIQANPSKANLRPGTYLCGGSTKDWQCINS